MLAHPLQTLVGIVGAVPSRGALLRVVSTRVLPLRLLASSVSLG